MNNLATRAALAAFALSSFAALSAGPGDITGAGATLPAAIYSAWGGEFGREKQLAFAYEPTGSGDGVKRIMARSVDFAGTDVPLTPDQLRQGELMQFPTLVGGIAPVVNLPGVKSGQLKLTGNVLASMFMRRITLWNDEAIKVLNPALKLPAMPIRLIVRSDRAGNTAVFAHYLADSNFDWKKPPGDGMDVKWPARALTAQGDAGLSALLKKTPGGISYISINTARNDQLDLVMLRNRSRNYVLPTTAALLAAIQASPLARGDVYASLTNLEGRDVWPIVEVTFIILEKQPRDSERARSTLRFFFWAFSKGDAMASDTGFVALPTSVQARVIAGFKDVHDSAGKPLQFVNALHTMLAALSMTQKDAWPTS